MGRAKVVKYRNNRYQGSLSDKECDILEMLLQTNSVPDLRHCIYELSDSTVNDIINHYAIGFEYNLEKQDRPLGTLSDLQTVGVAYMFWAKSMILGDSVGLGKTVQLAGLMNLLSSTYEKQGRDKPFSALIAVEATNLESIQHKLIKFTGEYVYALPGDKKYVESFLENYAVLSHKGVRYIVCNHSILKNPQIISWLTSFEESPFDLLCIDESSILGNPTSQMTKSVKGIRKYFSRVILLNATPFESKLDIFYTQLSVCDESFLPTKTNFQKEYFVYDYRGMYPRHTGKYKNAETFRNLVSYRYFARTRKANGGKMVDCNFKLVMSPLNKVQRTMMYKTSLWRMVCDCPSYIDQSITFNEDAVPKLKSLWTLFKTDLSEADSILIFAPYKESQKWISQWLTNKGISNRILNGEIIGAERNKVIRDFSSKLFRVLVTNVQKGLDFDNCNHCVFYSFDSNPQKMVQAEGRMTRSFDIVGKNVYLLCSEGRERKTLDEAVSAKAAASKEFANADYSLIMSLLLSESN